MCRLLYMNTHEPRDPAPLLERFAEVCRNGEEYQGHGWGAVWQENGRWLAHRSLTPIWEEPALRLPVTDRMLVHARSAFRNQGIELTNNMPFRFGRQVFAFNGELHGVRVRAPGRIGAEKVFNLHRKDAGDLSAESDRVRSLLIDRTRRILGMNWILCDADRTVVSSFLGERPDYYTLHLLDNPNQTLVCSRPLNDDPNWEPVAPGIMEVTTCTS